MAAQSIVDDIKDYDKLIREITREKEEEWNYS